MNREFSQRSRMLIGEAAFKRLEAAHITVCGLGGVGSWAAEALARSGIGTLTLIDFDQVSASNINRQLPAEIHTIGQDKTAVMAARFARINPECRVEICSKKLNRENLPELIPGCDYLIDAIDDLPAKADLISYCIQQGLPVLSSMGAGNKLAPELLKTGDISQTTVCPLARSLRRRLREKGIEKGVQVVYSEERPHKADKDSGALPASMVFVPAAAGLILASLAVRNLIKAGDSDEAGRESL